MSQGKVNAAIQLHAEHGRGESYMLRTSLNLLTKLWNLYWIFCCKHPNSTPARPEAFMMGNADPPQVHPVVHNQIPASCKRSVALRVKGAAGPSGLDVHCWRKPYTLLANRFCNTLVNKKGISHLLAFHLNALNKCPGLRPIGIGKTHGRIIAKAVLLITISDLQDAACRSEKLLCRANCQHWSGCIFDKRTVFS